MKSEGEAVRDVATPALPEEAALVRRARGQDKKAFAELVRIYQKRIWALVYRLTKERDAAWDLSQDTFVKAYFAIGSFREGMPFYPWLATIAVHLALNYLKREKRQVKFTDEEMQEHVLESQPATSNPIEEMISAEMQAKLEGEIDRLPPEYRAVFVLRVYEEMSYDQIAKTLEISQGTVMSRLFRARQRLLAALKEHLA